MVEVFNPLSLEGEKGENTRLCQGWGGESLSLHLSELCCPSVIHGDKDGLANNRDISSGKAICSLSSVISGENEMCPKKAQPCLPI